MALVEVQARANLFWLSFGQVDTVDAAQPEIAACIERGLLVVRGEDGTFPEPQPAKVTPGGCGCGH